MVIPESVDMLILGGTGWLPTGFLIPLLEFNQISYRYTTRSPTPGLKSISWSFESTGEPDLEAYKRLPYAKTVVIVFPIKELGASEKLVLAYLKTHPQLHGQSCPQLWIQLGSTGVWQPDPAVALSQRPLISRNTPISTTNQRGLCEAELLALKDTPACVLNLAGLWGGKRDMKNYIPKTKEALKGKGSLHMIHGDDVSRAIVALHLSPSKAIKQRFILTDLEYYDWWSFTARFGTPEQQLWVLELISDEGVSVLPRGKGELGRIIESSEFWFTWGLAPTKKLE